jgi:glycosyltransferase involved in cell wall biosynthesis
VLGLLDCASEAPIVAHLGRLHPRKGQLELIEVAPQVLAERPEVRFLLVPPPAEGDAERAYEGLLRRRTGELGVEHAITLAPRRGGSIEIMAGCDVVAVPSVPDEVSGWREGFGLVGVEAMAVGTPVVGYADGALPEVLGECALLVPTTDRKALGEAIVRLLENQELSRRLVDCGRRRVERYRLSSTIELLKERYREALTTASR